MYGSAAFNSNESQFKCSEMCEAIAAVLPVCEKNTTIGALPAADDAEGPDTEELVAEALSTEPEELADALEADAEDCDALEFEQPASTVTPIAAATAPMKFLRVMICLVSMFLPLIRP